MKKHNILALSFLATFIMASCGKTPANQQSSVESELPPEPISGFNVTTDINEMFEIHTADQKKYLEWGGDYSKMPLDQYPDGNEFNSDSLPVKIDFEHEPDEGFENYTVTYGKEADLSDGYELIGSKTKSVSLINPYLGKNYFQLHAYYDDGSVEDSEIMEFDVDSVYPRNLKIEGLTNCRDMGGRTTEDGGTVKQGLLYRTSGNNFQTKSQNSEGRGIINANGKKELLEHIGLKTEINVNSNTQYNINLQGTTQKNFYMDYGGNAASHFSRNAESVKAFFKCISDESVYPAAFHCRIGTDRTGLCAILTSGLLGVDLNDIYQDYLFSNFGNIEDKRKIGEAAGQDNIENYVNDIQMVAGKSFKNKVYNTLLSIGVPAANLDSVISILTEGELASGNKAGQIVATADKFELGGGATLTAENLNNRTPANVLLNSSSKTVSYSFSTSEAYKGQVVAYLGNTENSSTKKIGSAISCSLDGKAVTIRDVTYAKAGMGNVNNRINYYPVVLGEVDVPAGNHKITITGTSNTMNIGSICVFNTSK